MLSAVRKQFNFYVWFLKEVNQHQNFIHESRDIFHLCAVKFFNLSLISKILILNFLKFFITLVNLRNLVNFNC